MYSLLRLLLTWLMIFMLETFLLVGIFRIIGLEVSDAVGFILAPLLGVGAVVAVMALERRRRVTGGSR